MEERLKQELDLLRQHFPELKIDDDSRWICLPSYPLPEGVGWNKQIIDVCIELKPGFPGVAPYGIYVPVDLRCNEQKMENSKIPAKNQPTFQGEWAMISWSPKERWDAGADVLNGSNLLNFVLSFKERFLEGV